MTIYRFNIDNAPEKGTVLKVKTFFAGLSEEITGRFQGLRKDEDLGYFATINGLEIFTPSIKQWEIISKND
ncbi:MAG: hypothetical protein HWN81_14950 [Candidatus Lokiarchaeota archaeon]|nr:hypothetical protein [Candidatus Lokiarchaeota archaeon]